MKNADLAQKNYDKNLWSDEMLDKLEIAGKISKAEKDLIKLNSAKKK